MQERIASYYHKIPRVTKHILFWMVFVAFFAILYGSFNEDYLLQLKIQLLYLPEKLLATYLTIYVLLPRFLLKEKYALFFGWVILVLLVSGFLHWVVAYHLERPLYFPDEYWGPFWYPNKILKSATYVYPVVVLATLIKFFKHWYKYQAATQRLIQEKLEAELKFLRAQVHPHFLFNTLNNLYALTLKKSDAAPTIVLKLSDLLNYMLYECNTDKVPLSKEIELLENYVSLEKLRYGEHVDISFKVKGDVSGKTIAPMLILPFIENSFKHGVSGETDQAWVSIDITLKDNLFTLKVDNSKSGEVTKDENQYKEGIGLNNVKRRLELLCADRYDLKIMDTDESYLVVLKLELND